MSREQTEGGTNGDDFEVEGYYYFTVMQGGIKCKSLRAGLINSKDPKHSRNCICRVFRDFSGVIFPYFDGS